MPYLEEALALQVFRRSRAIPKGKAGHSLRIRATLEPLP
jgi:hypothetical protein